MTLGEIIDKYWYKADKMHIKLGKEDTVRGDGMITIYEGAMADIPDYLRERKVIDTFNNSDGTPWNIDIE